MLHDGYQKFADNQEAESEAFKNELKAIEKKIDTHQEKHYINGEISTDVYNKLNAKLEFQKHEIQQNSMPTGAFYYYCHSLHSATTVFDLAW